MAALTLIRRQDTEEAYILLLFLALFLDNEKETRSYITRQEIGELVDLSEDERDEGLAELYQLSLVQKYGDKFSLHSLLKAFILKDLTQ